MTAFGTLSSHLRTLRAALDDLAGHEPRIERWGAQLAAVLDGGGRLLAAGNGGSAAEAQHLTAEIVGRFESGRRPLSAIALHAETSSVTAIANDFGLEQMFARQVAAHGRRGDVLLLLTTSGRSPNLLAAAQAARTLGLRVWALTGPAPNPLSGLADDTLDVGIDCPTATQEVHLVVVHALCAAIERHLPADSRALPDAARIARNGRAHDGLVVDVRDHSPATSLGSADRGQR